MPWQRLNAALLTHIPYFDGAIFAAADDARTLVDEGHASDSVGVPSELEKTSVRNQVPNDDVCVGTTGNCMQH
jgi:hypothetical protein